MTLDELAPGEQAAVREIRSGPGKRRLEELGLTPGTAVTALRVSPSGDPVAYAFRGAVVALRRTDARSIEIKGR